MKPKPKILIVEDENNVALNIEQCLQNLDYKVCGIASTGQEAVEKTHSFHPNLVLIDIQLKGHLSGTEVAEKIISKFDIPIIFLTAYADLKILQRAKTVQPFGYILKPFKENELGTTIEIALYRSRHQKIRNQQLKLALHRAEEQYRLLIESVKDYAIFMLDAKGHVATWNSEAERISGYSRDEIVGKHFSIFLTPESIEKEDAQKYLETAIETGRTENEGWHLRKDGSLLWATIILARVNDDHGNLIGFSKIIRDLTERKKWEDRQKFLMDATEILTSSLDYYETLNRVAHVVVPTLADWCCIHLLDERNNIQCVSVAHKNPELEQWATEIQKRYPVDLKGTHGIANVIRTGKPDFCAEVPDQLLIENAYNEEHLSMMRSVNLKSYMTIPLLARGRILGCLSLLYSEQKRDLTEKDLELATELARRAAMAIDNAKLYEEAQTAIRARDEFLSIASHELKTPISSLKLQLQMTQRGINLSENKTPPVHKLFRAVDLSAKQVDRLTLLVDELLDVSKIRSGKLSFNFEEIDLVEILKEIQERFCNEIVHFELIAPPHVLGHWDRFRLEQVFVNLVGNAIKYAPGKPFRIEINQTFQDAIITVQDEGPGIDKEKQRRIFNRFERGDTSERISGLGLGLFIAKGVISGHGGSIDVESELGKGTKFTIVLPLQGTKEQMELAS
ncbi:MAG: PAS domain S-box protein [Deltaproteobacteria bacterium]|nr:PAS domain S-box protein [Deltaproteobacteria bacterium]